MTSFLLNTNRLRAILLFVLHHHLAFTCYKTPYAGRQATNELMKTFPFEANIVFILTEEGEKSSAVILQGRWALTACHSGKNLSSKAHLITNHQTCRQFIHGDGTTDFDKTIDTIPKVYCTRAKKVHYLTPDPFQIKPAGESVSIPRTEEELRALTNTIEEQIAKHQALCPEDLAEESTMTVGTDQLTLKRDLCLIELEQALPGTQSITLEAINIEETGCDILLLARVAAVVRDYTGTLYQLADIKEQGPHFLQEVGVQSLRQRIHPINAKRAYAKFMSLMGQDEQFDPKASCEIASGQVDCAELGMGIGGFSGGPVFVQQDGQYRLVGIYSGSHGVKLKHYVDVVKKITEVLAWKSPSLVDSIESFASRVTKPLNSQLFHSFEIYETLDANTISAIQHCYPPTGTGRFAMIALQHLLPKERKDETKLTREEAAQITQALKEVL